MEKPHVGNPDVEKPAQVFPRLDFPHVVFPYVVFPFVEVCSDLPSDRAPLDLGLEPRKPWTICNAFRTKSRCSATTFLLSFAFGI